MINRDKNERKFYNLGPTFVPSIESDESTQPNIIPVTCKCSFMTGQVLRLITDFNESICFSRGSFHGLIPIISIYSKIPILRPPLRLSKKWS